MNQPQPSQSASQPLKSYLKWLLIILAVVIPGGGLYYYFGIFKGGKTTVTASPSPATTLTVSPSKSTGSTSKIEFTTIKQESGYDLKEKKNYVVKDNQDWNELWQKMNQGLIPIPELPAIDFSKNMVILVAAGQKNSGGYDIEITDVQEKGVQTFIYVDEISPGKDCLVTLVLTQPYQAIEIPKTDNEIKFIPQEIVKNCE